MRSIFVTKFGGPDVLKMSDAPIPEPKESQVRIKVEACGLNYADIMQREGLYPNGPKPPFGAGFDVSGVIDAVGADATEWKVGDAVCGFCENGYSDYVTTEVTRIMPKPASLDFQQAAAIPCQYLSAYHTLVTLSGVKEGQFVLLQAAAGGLGTLMVQIAKNLGAKVIGTCSTDEKCQYLEELGCDFPINYSKRDFAAEAKRITGGAGCDLIVDSIGGEIFDKSLRCLKPRGRLVAIGLAGKQPNTVTTLQLLTNNFTVSGFHLMTYVSDAEAMFRAIQDLEKWLSAGTLKIVVRHVFPLEQAAEAQKFVAERKSSGKVVLVTAG
ncbi:MAG: NADPH:quinone oxidoreductase family protein [Candidatus Hydrogenedentales bacterium]|jgi:NADPH2:quinone reductase